jgi:hypothetical protein
MRSEAERADRPAVADGRAGRIKAKSTAKAAV